MGTVLSKVNRIVIDILRRIFSGNSSQVCIALLHFIQVQNGFPLNVRGRTGLRGRGILGRYGPNHAADPVVTRWKRDPDSGEVITSPKNGRQILQFVGIQRRDTGEWAIPGGMVDAGTC